MEEVSPEPRGAPQLDYATPEHQSYAPAHPLLAAACVGVGALLCGVMVPCAIADYPARVPQDTATLLVGLTLCSFGMWLKRRRVTPKP